MPQQYENEETEGYQESEGYLGQQQQQRKVQGQVTEREPNAAKSLEYQLELRKEIRRTILKLQGYTFDWNSRTWKVPKDQEGNKTREPMLNEKGIQLIDSVLGVVLNKNTLMSNLSDKEITRIVLGIWDVLNKELTYHKDKYGVQSEIKTILREVCDPIYLALKRARHAGERKSVTESSQRVERTVSQQGAKNKIRQFLGI